MSAPSLEEIKLEYATKLKELVSKVQSKNTPEKLDKLFDASWSLTKRMALKAQKCGYYESWAPNREWVECKGAFGREIKFLREEVDVISRFLNSKSVPAEYSNCLVKCIDGSQAHDGKLYDESGVELLCYFEICSPKDGQAEAISNREVTEKHSSSTGWTSSPEREWGIEPVKDIVLQTVENKEGKDYPEKIILIVEAGTTQISQAPKGDSAFTALDKSFESQFENLADSLKIYEFSNFLGVYLVNRWSPHQIRIVKGSKPN